MTILTGTCLCGSVQFELTTPSLWSSHCHCRLCQRAHGAAFVTWVGVASDGFKLLADSNLRWYESSPDSKRGFCQACGSTLFFQSQRWPGEMHVVRSNIDGELDLPPSIHSHWESHVEWFNFEDGLPHEAGE